MNKKLKRIFKKRKIAPTLIEKIRTQKALQAYKDKETETKMQLEILQKKFERHLANLNNSSQTDYSVFSPVDYSVLSSEVWDCSDETWDS
ncbi:hypothetical protein ACFL23_03830 [Patescibacteria group bacterium]